MFSHLPFWDLALKGSDTTCFCRYSFNQYLLSTYYHSKADMEYQEMQE